MAQAIHPKLHKANIVCSCNNKFSLMIADQIEQFNVESCYLCHPAYTGKRREVELDAFKKFAQKYSKYSSNVTSSKIEDNKK